jgi:hypothetical protein
MGKVQFIHTQIYYPTKLSHVQICDYLNIRISVSIDIFNSWSFNNSSLLFLILFIFITTFIINSFFPHLPHTCTL